ncbi:MAG: hypothetical protein LJE65_07415 [Desulfobacteraceae bacterium]|nr:hypothetical protein [Desulfobacteraceae bacterium]
MTRKQGTEGDRSPSVGDFSRRAVQKAVVKEGLTHPLTLYPPALGLLGVLAGVLFAYPPLFLAAIGAGVLGLGSGVVNVFLREEALAGRYLDTLNKELEQHRQKVLDSLRDDLEKGLTHEATRPYAQRGLAQFDRSHEKYRNVEDLLDGKLSPSEITYGRFQSAAKQVYLSVLDNLKTVAAVFQSAGTIDEHYIQSRLRALRTKPDPSETDQKERSALDERLTLLRKQCDLVEKLLALNETAMTRLEETTSQLAVLKTDGRFSGTDLETAIEDLQLLARNAHRYNPQPLTIEEVGT